MIDAKVDKSAVKIAKERYQRAYDANAELRQLSISDTQFALGDSDNGWQYESDDILNPSSINSVNDGFTINITAQHCNQIINNVRQNTPSSKVMPVDSFADKKTAVILGGMLRSIQNISNADVAHDIAFEHAVYGGEGYWRVLTEYESQDSFDQVITIKPLSNPQLVLIDPDAILPDRSDAKWGFIFEDLSKEQFQADYPEADMSSWVEQGSNGWVQKDTVRIAEYFYCENEPDTLLKLSDGSVELKSKLPDVIKIIGDYMVLPDKSQIEIVAKRDTLIKKWYWCKLIGGEDNPVDKKEWLGSYLPIIAVIGKELNVDGKIVRKGLVRDLKDAARVVNYAYTSTVKTLAAQNKVPYMASAESIEGYEQIWGAANIETRAYLPYNERDAEGNPLQMPSRQPGATMATAQVQLLQLSVEQMRASSGQQNANFGIKSEAASGVGIQRLKAQGEIATFNFPDNLSRALKYEAVVILDLIPKIYDSKRVVRILGMDGKESMATLDPGMDKSHKEDNEADIKEAFNPTVGKYDVAIDTGPSYQTQRQESVDALMSLSQSMPQLASVAGDLVVKSMDFPLADEISQRLAKALPPGLADDNNSKVPPALQNQMQQMNQHIDDLTKELHESSAENEKLKNENEWKIKELTVKAYDSETNRIKALGTGLSSEQVQALALQAVRDVMATPAPSAGIQQAVNEYNQDEMQENQQMNPQMNQQEPQMNQQMNQQEPHPSGMAGGLPLGAINE